MGLNDTYYTELGDMIITLDIINTILTPVRAEIFMDLDAALLAIREAKKQAEYGIQNIRNSIEMGYVMHQITKEDRDRLEQKAALIEMMRLDQKDGLYET
jgi:hypothetical protein